MDDLDDLEFLNILEKNENKRPRRNKSHRKNDIDTLDDTDFLKRYRLSKCTVREILALLDLPEPSSGGFSKMEQLLIALRFYASSSFQIIVGDLTDCSQPSVSRIIRRVSRAIAILCKDFIQMPTDREELEKVNEDFYSIAAFPGVVGCIDCTHVRIQSPGGDDAERYRCRKGYFSLNVQTVVDANLIIRNVIARWPGSVHDSTIFNASSVKAKFESGVIQMTKYHLLGDSGYALKPFMMTPILNPQTEAEDRYNKSQIRTRNVIERKYGVLKRRFPCLFYGLRCALENVPPIITACCILHNLAVKNGDPEPPPDPQLKKHLQKTIDTYSNRISSTPSSERSRTNAGHAKRNLIIERCFS